MGGDPLTIVAETSRMEKESMKGALWVLREGAKDFAKVNFLDTAGKKQKKDIYDEGDYTVSDVAFVGNTAFVAVAVSGGDVSGYFKLDSAGIRAWDMDEDGKSEWLYGYATGAIDRDFRITSICSFPLAKNVRFRVRFRKRWGLSHHSYRVLLPYFLQGWSLSGYRLMRHLKYRRI